MRRSTDAVTIRVSVLLFVCLLVFTATVYAQYQPMPAVLPSSSIDGYTSLDRRVGALENMRIDARLSVLEDVDKRTGEIRLLAYGTICTLLGNIALTIWERRRGSSRRRNE